jgi:D-alanyl-D-alanine endopeptidase (penicillin-binding protein 7)
VIDSLFGLVAAMSIASPSAAPGFLNTLPVAGPVQQEAPAPQKKDATRIGVQTTSRSIFIADAKTGAVLYAKHAHDVLPIASLTKLMTAMVFLDTKPDLNAPLTILEEDIAEDGKSVFKVGDVMTQGQAFEALLVGSVNTAGNALARVSLGTEAFVQAMNDKARSLKLTSPIFVEPTGLDARNRASAADVAALLTTAMSYPEIRTVSAKPQSAFTTTNGHAYALPSTNLLLSTFLNKKPFQILGAKTGSLPMAGFCMAQITRDANGNEVVVASLGSTNHFSRYQDVKAATAWAFDTFVWK